MVEEKKVSVRFHIDKRVKGEKFKGDTYYPVYARINFQSNNTNIKVLDRFGQGIFVTETNMDAFKEFHESGSENMQAFLWGDGSINLLDKEQLYIKALQFEYERQNEKFNFKDFTVQLKKYEKDVYHLLYSAFFIELKRFTESRTDDINYIKRLNLGEISNVIAKLDEWKVKTELKEMLPQTLKLLGEATISYLFYNRKTFEAKLISKKYGMRRPSERGTVFAWLHGDDRVLFIEEFQDNFMEKCLQGHPRKFYLKEFIELFITTEENKDLYPQIIDGLVG